MCYALVAMPSERKIYLSANILLNAYGDSAEAEASERADELQRKGDTEGAVVWRRIQIAVEKLRKAAPTEGDVVH